MKLMNDLKEKFSSKSSHFFILHMNVSDYVHFGGEFLQLEEFLKKNGPASDPNGETSGFVAYFNRGIGINFLTSDEEKKFVHFLKEINESLPKDFYKFRKDIGFMLGLFNDLLKISWDTEDRKSKEVLEKIFGKDFKNNSGRPVITLIIEYGETIVPPNSSHQDASDRNALVAFQVWAKNAAIRNANNLVIIIAESLSAIAPALRLENNDATPLKIPLPSYESRLLVIQEAKKKLDVCISEMSDEIFADLSAGLTVKIIVNLLREAKSQRISLNPETVFRVKKKFLEDQSNGLLEVIKPIWGIEAIGSLEKQKAYIREVVQAMKNKDLAAVPMGVLLLGPPGVGKTVFAEALAHEAGIPMLIMKNIREMWVGQSERNLDFALEIIKGYAPVIIFIDEIDQQYQSRGSGFNGDSGVSARIQGKIFEFMSDTNLRGKVLWIAASNRPDMLDPAMLREGRFDEKIPFFPPVPEDRAKILEAILQKKLSQSKAGNSEFRWNLTKEDIDLFGAYAHCHHDEDFGLISCDGKLHKFGSESENEVTYTGAEIESIVSRAYMSAMRKRAPLDIDCLMEALKDFIPNRNLEAFDAMIDLAIMHCNSEKFLPQKWKERARKLRRMKPKTNRIDLS